ncbi:uncharacterized protein LOC121737471 [Aricia agestis]|uniref:uncharacterized protein LOC121737471 n=1 Tax=Aricia agestis TaxID=91739 RepID=UPI001C20B25A|nr:uncharacterized protein LOC121737471 [Aricia agestis]
MSGYLEVKYPFKSNLGLNPFKTWKRQWCILRPSPTYVGGGSLAVYCSEAGAPAGTVELQSGCVVKRAKSRSRPYAFAVFSTDEPSKPRILLAAQSIQETNLWMDKIRTLLSGEKLLGTETLLKDTYVVTVVPTDLSRTCELTSDCRLTLSSNGLIVTQNNNDANIQWQYIKDVIQMRENDKKCCVISIDSCFNGGGELKLTTSSMSVMVSAIKQALRVTSQKKLSRSDGDLNISKSEGDIRRSSWNSGPSDVSLDDTDLIMSKGGVGGRLSRCGAAADRRLHLASLTSLACTDDSAERRSLVSIASGVYEEITENFDPAKSEDTQGADVVDSPRGFPGVEWEPMYESVAECVYGTMRRARPPPLPPRHPGTLRNGEWAGDSTVTRHSSLGALHRCDKPRSRQPFSVFRKRLKSDSRVVTSKSESPKEKDVETKKKRFDFTPTKDIFKSFRVSRKMKNLKITNNLGKGETKSCEFLDETDHVSANRCSKSVECLDENDEFDEFVDLSLVENAIPTDIVQLILHSDIKVRLKEQLESEYMPMSPIVPPAPIDHYIVMSPRTNLA